MQCRFCLSRDARSYGQNVILLKVEAASCSGKPFLVLGNHSLLRDREHMTFPCPGGENGWRGELVLCSTSTQHKGHLEGQLHLYLALGLDAHGLIGRPLTNSYLNLLKEKLVRRGCMAFQVLCSLLRANCEARELSLPACFASRLQSLPHGHSTLNYSLSLRPILPFAITRLSC